MPRIKCGLQNGATAGKKNGASWFWACDAIIRRVDNDLTTTGSEQLIEDQRTGEAVGRIPLNFEILTGSEIKRRCGGIKPTPVTLTVPVAIVRGSGRFSVLENGNALVRT